MRGVFVCVFVCAVALAVAVDITEVDTLHIDTIGKHEGFSHKCIHDEHRKGLKTIRLEESNVKQKRAQGPMRITFDDRWLSNGADGANACYNAGDSYTTSQGVGTCRQAQVITSGKKQAIMATLNWAKGIFQDSYEIMQESSLQPVSSCPGSVDVPAAYVQNGVASTDLLILVTGRPIPDDNPNDSSFTLAYAAPCQDNAAGRPVVGYINFDPERINEDPDQRSEPGQQYTALHELTHVLGFTKGKFGDWPGGNPVNKIPATAGAAQSSHLIEWFESTNVIQKARQHFGCTTLRGGELENDGGDGTAGSHWEKRVYGHDYMTGRLDSQAQPQYSAMTMALLEDSGWYFPDYTKAEKLDWGYKQGCNFATPGMCNDWPSKFYYCEENTNSFKGCTADRKSMATCPLLGAGSTVPAYDLYQSTDGINIAGTDNIADNCPKWSAASNGWCVYDDGSTGAQGVYSDGSKFCETCRCFESNLVGDLPAGSTLSQTPVVSCHDKLCLDADTLYVIVKDIYYRCAWGEKISVDAHDGQIVCPLESENFCIGQEAATDGSGNPVDDQGNAIVFPEVTAVTPSKDIKAGDELKITGLNFQDGDKVFISDKESTEVKFVSATELKAVAPDFGIVQDASRFLIVKNSGGYTGTFPVAYTVSGLDLPLNFCFVSTSAYGSSVHPHVLALREFRDSVLNQSIVGRMFVQLYYGCSPMFANALEQVPVFKAITRMALHPLVVFAQSL